MPPAPTDPQPDYLLSHEDDTIALGRAIAASVRPGALVILDGQLGAGKTFLAQAIIHALGLDPDEPVTSPTYNLVSEYQVQFPVYHADLYRLRNAMETFELGLDENRSQGGVLLVEWGLPHIDALGGDALVVELQTDPRRATLRSTGAHSAALRQRVLAHRTSH